MTKTYSQRRDEAAEAKWYEPATVIFKAGHDTGFQADEVKAMRDALLLLLHDTEHWRHNCGDVECPVEYARAKLAAYEKALQELSP